MVSDVCRLFSNLKSIKIVKYNCAADRPPLASPSAAENIRFQAVHNAATQYRHTICKCTVTKRYAWGGGRACEGRTIFSAYGSLFNKKTKVNRFLSSVIKTAVAVV